MTSWLWNGRRSGGRVLLATAGLLLLAMPTVARSDETAAMPAPVVSFEGVSNDQQQAVNGARANPPDTVGDVGPDHYVQAAQHSIAVYTKTGTLLKGPYQPNTLWTSGYCSTANRGDPIVLYDQLADRWVFGMFAYADRNLGPFFQCLAVSKTPDPTGDWHVYQIPMPTRGGEAMFNDYPKLAVWPDAYLMTVMQQDPVARVLEGSAVFAFDRQALIDGAEPRWAYLDLPDIYSLLPAELDGHRLPPAGTPAVLGQIVDGPDEIRLWTATWDFDTKVVTLGGPEALATAPFDSELCSAAFNLCIPQPDGAPTLDAISDRLMFRAAYRNLGGRQVLLLNHTVDVDGSDHAGIRWYEIHDPAGPAPSIHQQGTFAPDAHHRWMGSIAMDASGNVALGYSVGSASLFPSIRYAGRLASDPPGSLAQAERSIVEGGGSQTTNTRRWGDYSAMVVDSEDDCTFWYTTAYYSATSTASWQTRIAAFRFPSCGMPGNVLAPTVQGTPAVGSTLTAGTGGWSGYPEPTVAKQWLLCDGVGSSCTPVAGAVGDSLLVGEEHAGDTFRVRVTATNEHGSASAESSATAPVADPAAPVTTATAVPGPNVHGWNDGDVSVALTAADGVHGSGVAEIRYSLSGAQTGAGTIAGSSGGVVVSSEGETTVRYHAVDGEGNAEAAKTVTVRIDKTSPSVEASRTPGPNVHGWNNTDVVAHFGASDALSGIDGAATAVVTFGAEGVGHAATRTFRDRAGNEASAAVSGISIDKTPPNVAASRAPEPNEHGWNDESVNGRFEASDPLSGLDGAATADVLFDREGADQAATRAFRDRAGNEADATVSGVSIDLTAPVVTCRPTPAVLWPPDHRRVGVHVGVRVVDALSGQDGFELVAAGSNHADDARGAADGNTTGDVAGFRVGLPDVDGWLRAERDARRGMRIYTLTYLGHDLAGNEAPCDARVRVPVSAKAAQRLREATTRKARRPVGRTVSRFWPSSGADGTLR